MLAPGLHPALQVKYKAYTRFRQLLRNKFGRAFLGANDQQLPALGNVLQRLLHSIQQLEIWNIERPYTLAFYFPILKIRFIPHIQNK
ncbi:hypothetical protein D3C78_1085530 [compost metagenome]